MEESKKKLKPCKKCGGRAELLIKCSFKGYFCYGKCKNCGRKSKKIYMNYLLGIFQKDIQTQAKEEWNKKNSKAERRCFISSLWQQVKKLGENNTTFF